MREERRRDASAPLALKMRVIDQKIADGCELLFVKRLSDLVLFAVVSGRSQTVLSDVEGIARQKVASQRVLFVDLQTQQLFEIDLRLLYLRFPRKRARDLCAGIEGSFDGKTQRQKQETRQQHRSRDA